MATKEASRIRQRRKELGISQEALAQAVGTNQGQISKFEHGDSSPSTEVLAALARELKVTADWLIGLSQSVDGHIEECDLSTKEQEAVSAWRRGEHLEAIKTIVLDEETDRADQPKTDAA